jgi:hypothetical protein
VVKVREHTIGFRVLRKVLWKRYRAHHGEQIAAENVEVREHTIVNKMLLNMLLNVESTP